MTVEEYAKGLAETVLKDYCFNWAEGKVALALGYGSIYNHSYRPNARYDDVGPLTKEFTATPRHPGGRGNLGQLQRRAPEPGQGLVRRGRVRAPEGWERARRAGEIDLG